MDIKELDSGQSEAFNKGFKKAKGDFLFWLNADDYLIKGSLAKVADFIKSNPNANWISANTIFFDENESILKCTNGPSWSNYLVKNAGINMYGPSSFFRRELFENIGGFKENLHFSMDTDLWYRFVNKGEKYVKIHEYIWAFRIHIGSKTSHSFSGGANSKMRAEKERINYDNNIDFNSFAQKVLKVFKFFNGNYLKSYIDTRMLKGKKISDIFI